MYHFGSLIFIFWATTASSDGNIGKRFVLDRPQFGDPQHQGGYVAGHRGLNIGTGLPLLLMGDPFHQGMGTASGQTSPPGSTTTNQPKTELPSTTKATVVSTTASVLTTTTVDFCGVAKQLCTANCPGGYLVDPMDCTFCICKKDALPA